MADVYGQSVNDCPNSERIERASSTAEHARQVCGMAILKSLGTLTRRIRMFSPLRMRLTAYVCFGLGLALTLGMEGQAQALESYIWPAQGVISSNYGQRHGRMHQGIDIAGPVGTPILAAASGTVTRAGATSGGYGNLVEIEHEDGSLTRYGHNSKILVSVGQTVTQGQEIAEMGNTGRSSGPHCHFEIRMPQEGAVNPLAYLPAHFAARP